MVIGRVVVHFGKAKAYKRFDNIPDLKGFYLLALKKFGIKHVTLVTYRVKPRPEGLNYRQLWCPFCGEVRKFPTDKSYRVRRCEICGISEADWAVKTYNAVFCYDIDLRKPRAKKKSTMEKEARSVEERKRQAKRERARERRKARRDTSRGSR